MAVRRHLEHVWRAVSTNHGFDEIDGPTFEHLELYTAKSGDGIVSELFSFRRAGGDTDYALRPEFTPTLARMAAARGAQMAKPIKWYSIPTHYRAERPQRGRLREFIQWNVDILGDDSPAADAEIMAVAVGVLERLGLTPNDVVLRISNRDAVGAMLQSMGVCADALPSAFELLDRREKLPPETFDEQALALLGGDATMKSRFDALCETPVQSLDAVDTMPDLPDLARETLANVRRELAARDLLDWCQLDFGIVRGLAYYTGTVFEVHEVSGKERAIAGGGRYDNLVELFGGKPTPAVGFAMGDVVIGLVLSDRGLLEEPAAYMPRPDVFVIHVRDDDPSEHMLPAIARLRRHGLHVRHSYRSTKNVGKLLGEAGKNRARFALIIGAEFDEGIVVIKDLDAGTQIEMPLAEAEAHMREKRMMEAEPCEG
ncbi:MAG: histidine--tRNA ligase [Planctomycetota bacterium]